MAKTVTLEQVQTAFNKDIEKFFAKLMKAVKKSKSVEDLQTIVSIYVDDALTEKTTHMALKLEDQENF